MREPDGDDKYSRASPHRHASDEPLLQLRDVNKSFGAVHVLQGVDLNVHAGRVTALVGDNGAGKSTLIKGIAGIHSFDSGEYLYDGEPVTVHSPKDSNALGIEVVYQDLALCDNLDVVHNMFLGREVKKNGVLDEVTMEKKAKETLAGLSVRTLKSVRTHVASLSGGQRQTVAIARAVLWNSRLVILDEPTAALGVAQTEQVLQARPPTRRQRPRRHPDQPQPQRRLRGRRRHRRPLPRQDGRAGRREDGQERRCDRADHHRAGAHPMSRPWPRSLTRATRRESCHEHHLTCGADRCPPDPEPDVDEASAAATLKSSFNDYLERVKGGDVGSLPAVLGLVVLVVFFSILRPETFTNSFNFANLINQSAAVMVIAMGLVFVLLLGEIDLAAGLHRRRVRRDARHRRDQPRLALVVGHHRRAAHRHGHRRLLRAARRVRRDPFVRRDAGRVPRLPGRAAGHHRRRRHGRLPQREPPRDHEQEPAGLARMDACGSSAWRRTRSSPSARTRSCAGQSSSTTRRSLWLVKFLSPWPSSPALAVWYLSRERSRNVIVVSLKGVPIVVVVLVVLLLVLTFMLSKTGWGRHVYAIGGNAEAARRAGIDVRMVRLSCFAMCSTVAAIAGILLGSRNNSITPATGGGVTLLLAVGAAVIGGTSLFGGKGKISDAVIGGLVVAVIQNGMLLLDQPAGNVYIVTGLVLLVAASVDALSRRRAAATGRA